MTDLETHVWGLQSVGAPDQAGKAQRTPKAVAESTSRFAIGKGPKASLTDDSGTVRKERRHSQESRWAALQSMTKCVATKNDKPTSGRSDSAKWGDVQDARGTCLTTMLWLNPILRQRKNPECET